MKTIWKVIYLTVLGFLAVSCYDDSALWNSMEEYESRLATLESRYKVLNDEVSSLKTLVAAIQKGDYITSVTPVKENGKEVGYAITFAESGTITIRHGQDAVPATTPMIGVRKDTDGIYYWTVDGEWLLDEAGKKVKAVGTDGKDGSAGSQGAQGNPGAPGPDGITPKLKIENEYWYVSYDDGKTWTPLNCKATGEDGAPGVAESLFKAVYQKDGYLVVELADGNVFSIPVAANGGQLDIHLDAEPGLAVVPGATVNIRYSIKGADENTMVRVISNVEPVLAIVKPENSSEGYICLYVEEWFDETEEDFRDEVFDEELFGPDVTENDFYHSLFSIIVTVVDGKGNQVMKVLNIDEGAISSVLDAYVADAAAGSVTAQVKTNVDYEVVIPQKDTWLTCSPSTKAQMRTDELVFSVSANEGDMFRASQVSLVTNAGALLESFVILQRSSIAGEKMTFADPVVERACVAAFDTNLDGAISYEEAALVTDLGKMKFPKSARSFDELKHFVGIDRIPTRFFSDCYYLSSVILPEQIKTIGIGAFSDCHSLASLVIPEGVESMGFEDEYYDGYNGLFTGCHMLSSLEIPAGVKRLNTMHMFIDCYNLTSVSLPPVTELGEAMFKGCESLTTFEIPESVEYIGGAVFASSGMTRFTLPERFTEVPYGMFENCQNLTEVILHDGVVSIGGSAFSSCMNLKNVDLPASLEVIQNDAFAFSGLQGKEVEIDGTRMVAFQIPASVQRIEYNVFAECYDLKAIQMLSPVPCSADPWGFPKHTLIFVPKGCYQNYKNAWGYECNWADKNVYVRNNSTWEETVMTLNDDGMYHARVRVETGNEFCFRDDTGREYYVITDYETVSENVRYELRLYEGRALMMPVSGIVDLYVSRDMSQFYYEMSEISDRIVLFTEDFSWVAPWADIYGSGDSVGTDDPSGKAPNVYTQKSHLEYDGIGYLNGGSGVEGYPSFLSEFTNRGYEDINPSVKSIYTQKYYLKFGKTRNHTGIKLPAVNVGDDATRDVLLSFDWSAHMTALGNIDQVLIVVELEGEGVCADSQEKISLPISHTQENGDLKWQNVSVQLSGITSSTRIIIRPISLVDYDGIDQQRWYIDNIMICAM